MRCRQIKFLVFLSVLLSACGAWGMEYYMRSDGTASSGNPPPAPGPCGTIGNTLNVANHNSSTFSAGDTIILCDDGGSFNNTITPPSSGSVGSPITYKSEYGGSPILTTYNTADCLYLNGVDWIVWDGINIQGCDDGVQLSNGSNYNIIQNIEIQNCDDRGIYLSGEATVNIGNTLKNNTIHDIDKDGIMITNCNNTTIQDSYIYDIDNGGAGANGDCIHMQYGDGLTVTRTKMNYDNPSGNNKQAIMLNNGDDGGAGAVEISYCTILSAYTGINSQGSGTLSIHHNEIYSAINMDSGPYIGAININAVYGAYKSPADIYYNLIRSDGTNKHFFGVVINNQSVNLYNNVLYGVPYGLDLGGATAGNTVTLKNNIIFPKSAALRMQDADWTYVGSNNVWWHDGGIPSNFWDVTAGKCGGNDPDTLAEWQSCMSQDSNSLAVDPLFTNSGSKNFHLQAGSQAINHGIDLGYTKDFDNLLVPYGNVSDIGAYEFQGVIQGVTPGGAPAVTTLAATSVGATTAILNGNVTANGLATNAWFEYGTDPSLASSTSTLSKSVGSGTTSQSVNAALTGLSTGTTYYYRVAASNGSGTTKGSIANFNAGSVIPLKTPSPPRGVTIN